MYKLLKYFSFLSAVGLIVTIAYFLNKGIDLSDEGYYLLSYLHPEESNELVRPFYFIFSDFVSLFDNEIIVIRGLNLSLTIFSSLVFSSGLMKWMDIIEERSSFKFFIHSFIVIGSLLSFSIFPISLSYNSFLQHLILLIFGTLLFYFKRESKSHFLILLIGFLTCITFFVKFTFTIVFIPFLMSFVFFFDANSSTKIRTLTYFLLGFLTAFIFFFALSATPIKNPVEYFKSAKLLLDIYPDHGVEDILLQYMRDIGHLIYYSFFTIPSFTFFLLLLIVVKEKIPKYDKASVFNFLFVGFSIWFLYHAYLDHWHQSGIGFMYSASRPFFLFLTLAAFTRVLLSSNKKSSELKSELLLLVFLFIIPFMASAGTNGYITVQILQYMPFWFAVIVLLIVDYLRQKKHTLHFVWSGMIVMIVLFSVSQIILGMVYHPYRISQPLTENNSKIEGISKSSSLEVDSTTKVFIETINNQINQVTNFKKGDPVIVLYDLPGLVYFLDGSPVGTSWYSRSSSVYNCFCLSNTKIKELNRTVIIKEDSKVVDTNFISCLNNKGINFPSNYRKILTLNHLLNSGETVSVFVPNDILK